MRKIVFFINSTGEIVGVDDYSDETEDAEIDADAPDGCIWQESDADPETDYMPGGVRTPRPTIDAKPEYHVDANGVTGTLFTMPDETTVTYRGEDFFVTGTGEDLDFIFSSTRTGEFEYMIDPPFPYKAITVTVIADAV
jgi:hypothetical protein